MQIVIREAVELMDATNPDIAAKEVPKVTVEPGTYECERIDNPFSPSSGLKWIRIEVSGHEGRVLGKSEQTLSRVAEFKE